MRNRILIGLLVLVVTGVTTYVLATRAGSPRTAARSSAEGPPPDVKLDPNDPTAHWPARYRGKPLLLVLEAYALDTIGELPPGMQQLVPELVQRAFGKSGDWKATVREQLGWAPTIDQDIRASWDRYQGAARDAGLASNSLDFAQQFADEVERRMTENEDAGRR